MIYEVKVSLRIDTDGSLRARLIAEGAVKDIYKYDDRIESVLLWRDVEEAKPFPFKIVDRT